MENAANPAFSSGFVPSAGLAETVFHDFRANYRAFEAWQVSQRSRVISNKLERSKEELFKSLRDPFPGQVDDLQIRNSYSISDSEPSARQVHLDLCLDSRGISTWTIDDRLSSSWFRQWLTNAVDIEAECVSLWKPMWQKHATCDQHAFWSLLMLSSLLLHGILRPLPLQVGTPRCASTN